MKRKPKFLLLFCRSIIVLFLFFEFKVLYAASLVSCCCSTLGCYCCRNSVCLSRAQRNSLLVFFFLMILYVCLYEEFPLLLCQ